MDTGRRAYALYIVAAVAVAALALSIYAVLRPAPTAAAQLATVKAKFYNATVDYPGYWHVPIGWVYVDRDAIIYLNVTATGSGRVYSVYIDGVEYNNPATAWLTPGNHTVATSVYAPGQVSIKVEYRVGT